MIDADIIKYFKRKIKDYDKDYVFSQEEVLNILERYERKYAKSTVEAIPKDQYETRLKADMVAMLTELKTEIHIMSDTVVESKTVTVTSWSGMQTRICKLIQQKINALKADRE